ncbi:MAG: hypothetical protein HFF90_01040 [Oscillibacter sp.]|nr:hypothetical protein [Oscillibacter sp.]
MARYFMGGTRLSGLERMMMDPTRTVSTRSDIQKKEPQKKLADKRSSKPRRAEHEGQKEGV